MEPKEIVDLPDLSEEAIIINTSVFFCMHTLKIAITHGPYIDKCQRFFSFALLENSSRPPVFSSSKSSSLMIVPSTPSFFHSQVKSFI